MHVGAYLRASRCAHISNRAQITGGHLRKTLCASSHARGSSAHALSSALRGDGQTRKYHFVCAGRHAHAHHFLCALSNLASLCAVIRAASLLSRLERVTLQIESRLRVAGISMLRIVLPRAKYHIVCPLCARSAPVLRRGIFTFNYEAEEHARTLDVARVARAFSLRTRTRVACARVRIVFVLRCARSTSCDHAYQSRLDAYQSQNAQNILFALKSLFARIRHNISWHLAHDRVTHLALDSR